MENKKSISIQYSVILSVIVIIYGLIIYYSGLLGQKWASYVSYVFFLGVTFLAQKKLAQINGNEGLSYGKAVGLAAIIGVFTAVILVIYNFLFYKFIAPDSIQQLIDMAEQQLIDRGMPDDQIEMALEMQKKFMTPIILSLFGFVGQFIGIFVSGLITAIFTKKEPILEA